MLHPAAVGSKPETAVLLRVLLLGWEYAPQLAGGLGTASARLAHALATQTDLSVIVPRLPGADDAGADPGAEPALSTLATTADRPDQLHHFPESADWSADAAPPVPRPAPRPAPPNAHPLPLGLPPARGQSARVTALSHLTPASVRAATVAPRPPRYEVFARQVHRIALNLLPYAELAEETPEPDLPKSETELSKSETDLSKPEPDLSKPETDLPKPETDLSKSETDLSKSETDLSKSETDLSKSETEPLRDAPAPADPLTEVLAPFQAPFVDPLVVPSSNTEVVQFARLAARVASGDALDVVYAHDWPTFLAGIEIRLEKKIPLVLHVHSTSYDRHGPPARGWVFELERAAFRAAERVITVSEYAAGVLRTQYGVDAARIQVVYHGLSAGPLGPQWEARAAPTVPTVLFVGRLTSQKNPLGFVEIARRVVAEVPTARFVVAGDGPQRAAVLAAAEAAGLTAAQFTVRGCLDDAAVTAALAAAAVVCLPAQSEPFGLAALEAAAAGVPLVLSTTTGAAEVLPGALTAPFDAPDALAAHVVALLRDEPARRRAVRENAAAARRLTWERAAAEVLAALWAVQR